MAVFIPCLYYVILFCQAVSELIMNELFVIFFVLFNYFGWDLFLLNTYVKI